jgi:hypothetical protein
VAAIAVEKGCPRLQWEVLDWNTPAIEFYRAMGAEFLDEWRNVRVIGEALSRLAADGGEDGACAPAEDTPHAPSTRVRGEWVGDHEPQPPPTRSEPVS